MLKIRPETISGYISFHPDDAAWKYDPLGQDDMYKLQAEGTAKLWNILAEKGIALLADEVGMGKTLQALAAIVTLWRQKPKAKVLLYAPNQNVALKWVNEYQNFINYHYRINDENIKSSITGAPIRKAVYVRNHIELLEKIKTDAPALLICKTSSLSHFGSKRPPEELGLGTGRWYNEVAEDQLSKWIADFGVRSNKKVYDYLGCTETPPFELLIIDEAHYFRRADPSANDNRTNRSYAASAFFNRHNKFSEVQAKNFPIAKQVLLLTATPNHSGPENIKTIISLFKPTFMAGQKPEELLNELCVRRFRRLQSKTKHQYREEIPMPVELASMPEKLFFAAYHKALVKHQSEVAAGGEGKRKNPYKVQFGYLEGFEFLPRKKEEETKPDEEGHEGEDFHTHVDTEVIRRLASVYQRAYGYGHPSHPKYDRLIEQLSPSGKYVVDKKLIFVRRIPSVFEASHRLISEYDKWLLALLEDFIPAAKLKRKQLLRSNLRELFASKTNEEELGEEETALKKGEAEELDETIPHSAILDLFTVKKGPYLKYKSTDCSNFRLRFTKYDQIFSLFFQPAKDYQAEGYKLASLHNTADGKRNYKKSVQHERADGLKDNADKNILATKYGLEEDRKGFPPVSTGLQTLLGIWWTTTELSPQEALAAKQAKAIYDGFSCREKEGFSQFLEKGILLASPFVVHLYAYYRKLSEGNKELRGHKLYSEFCRSVAGNITESGLHSLISTAILSFRVFYRKELAIKEEELLDETWNLLKYTIPVYPYCGATQRRSIIQAFNTPFFPNVLVSTSVLQEGVDLHYQCDKVVHYGIAWTPGDNEQRVGRVDRMFGKLDRNLQLNPQATLPIHYPYLRNTLDEDQLARFIQKKANAEEMIDKLKNVAQSKEVNLLQKTDGWKELLRKPTQNASVSDPFGVTAQDFSGIEVVESKETPVKSFLPRLLNTLRSEYKNSLLVFSNLRTHLQESEFAAIKYSQGETRQQAIFLDIAAYEKGISEVGLPAYCLKLWTPLKVSALDDYLDRRKHGTCDDLYQRLPGIKICWDDTKRRKAGKLYCRVDLLLYPMQHRAVNISTNELSYWISELAHFANKLEHTVTGGAHVYAEEVISKEHAPFSCDTSLEGNRQEATIPAGWKTSTGGDILYRSRKLGEFVSNQDVYRFNHLTPFTRRVNIAADTYEQIGIYKHNVTPLESQLFESLL